MDKINVAEILKDCPKGMELDCTMFENLEFDHIDKDNESYSIICCAKTEWGYNTHTFTEYGCYSTEKYSKCVIFPKGKTTWEGFHRPFKDGDIIITHTGDYTWASIFKQFSGNSCCTYADLCVNDNDLIIAHRLCDIEEIKRQRLATEEEKQKLFDTIKDNGYKWNPETKTLEKLSTDKFDINTLVPFESRVLVRNDELQYWIPAFWGCKRADGYTTTFGWCKYCIPFEGNEHLLENNKDCDEYYKTWK